MDCPACGRDNAADRMECEFCLALLVEAFDSDDDSKTDPIAIIGARDRSADTDALLRAAREVSDDDELEHRESLQRFQNPAQYTGELPRLFRFGNRYQILEKLGEGGMGRVYKALDLELDRAVALKTIRADKSSSREVRERFKQELILARKVTHKNVIRIYDLGESEGMKFFTMELVEGASLREVLNDKHKVPVTETLSFMKQMLNGLAEAHSQGVVHRDLKPQNIMVDGRGIIHIMDFGIARTADSATMTGTGEMMGTPDYISPEQVKGETANAQSDIYSFGVILYELLTGETPFKGDTPISKIVARIQAKAPSPRDVNPDIPVYLERIIMKCLEADPDLRYHSAEEVLEDVAREQVDTSLWLRIKKAIRRRPGWVAAACLAGAVGIGGWFRSNQPPPTVVADVEVKTLAVLPFNNMTGADDLEWMENGIPEMLITDMSQLHALRPVTAERIRRILIDLGKEGQTTLDDETVKVVAQLAGADHALHGSIVLSGDDLRLDLGLRESETGVESRLKFQGTAAEVFALVDRVTEEVATALAVTESNLPFAEVSTDSLRAFRAYHQGLAELSRGGNQTAIPFLKEAVSFDADFAMAYAKLAEAHFHLGNQAEAKEAARLARAKIAEAPPPLPELYQIHAIAARVEDDPDTAVRSYRELVRLYPQDPQVLLSLASSLETMGQVDDAIANYRSVLELAPQFGGALLGLGRMLVTNGRPREAIPILLQAVEAGDFEGELEVLGMIHSILGVAHRDLNEYDAAIAELQKSLERRKAAGDSRGVTATLTNLATVYAVLGQLDEAQTLLNEALAIAQHTGNLTMESFALVNLGVVYQQSGDMERALIYYKDSLEIEMERQQHTELTDRENLIGQVYAILGSYGEANVYLDQAKVHFEAANDPQGQGFNLYVRGQLQRVKGNYKEASEALLSSIPLLQETGQLRHAAAAHEDLALIYLDQGRESDAREAIRQSVVISKELKIPSRLVHSKLHQVRCFLELNELEQAAQALGDAEKLANPLDNGELAVLRLMRGKVLRRRGKLTEARGLLEQARRSAEDRGLFVLQLEASLELARINIDNGLFQRAKEIAETSLPAAKRRLLRPLQSATHLVLAEATLHLDRFEEVETHLQEAAALADDFGGVSILAQVDILRDKAAALRRRAPSN